MEFKKALSNMKDFFTGKKYSFPDAFIVVDFNESAKVLGISDDIVKEIKVNVAGKEPQIYPYSEALLNVLAKENRMPVFDATHIQQSPIEPILSSRPDILEMWK